MKFNPIAGLIGRHSTTAAGGGMVGAGLTSGNDALNIAGLVITVLGMIFSFLEKRKRPKVTTLPLLLVALLLMPVMVMTTGCKSVTPEDRISRMVVIAELAAYTGAAIDLGENPEHRPYYETAVAALDALLRDRDYDPAALAAALHELPIRQLQGRDGTILIGTAVILWDAYAAETIDLDRAVYIKPVIAAVRNGLSRTLNIGTPMTATPPEPVPLMSRMLAAPLPMAFGDPIPMLRRTNQLVFIWDPSPETREPPWTLIYWRSDPIEGQWEHLGLVEPGITRYELSAEFMPREAYFVATHSNIWGESDFSDVVWTPAPPDPRDIDLSLQVVN